jgi:hypothetical protein
VSPLVDHVVSFLARHGGMLLAGSTLLLALGGLGTLLHRSPVHRQRVGELTVLAVLLWIVLACVPLPRVAVDALRPAAPPPQPPAAVVELAGPSEISSSSLSPGAPIEVPEARELIAIDARPIASEQFTGAEDLPPVDAPGLAYAGTDAGPPPAQRASVPRTEQPATAPIELPALLAALYLAGGVVCLAWLVLGNALLAWMVRSASPAPPWLGELFGQLLAESPDAARVTRRPQLLVSARCVRPMSCGVFRPTIVLPPECAARDNAPLLRQVLLHELAHVRRGDARGNFLFNVALPLLYVHPLYGWLRRRVALARELVADDWAAGRTDKASYVAELVELARRQQRQQTNCRPAWRAASLAVTGLFVFRSTSGFYRRMHMLMQRSQPLATRCSTLWRVGCVAAWAAALGMATCAIGVRRATAQETEPQPATTVEPPPPTQLPAATPPAPVPSPPAGGERDAELKALTAEREALRNALAQAEQRMAAMEKQMADFRAARDREHYTRAAAEAKGALAAGANGKRAAAQAQIAERQARAAQADLQIQAAEVEVKSKAAAAARVAELQRKGLTNAEAVEEAESALELAKIKLKMAAVDRDRFVHFHDPNDAAAPTSAAAPRPETGPADVNVAKPGFAEPAAGAAAAAPAGVRGQLDLVALASIYADALGNVRVARARYDQAKGSGGGSATSPAVEQAALQAALGKAQMLHAVAEVALEAAAEERTRAEQRYETGLSSHSEFIDADAKVKILRLILGTTADDPNNADNGPAPVTGGPRRE